MVVWASVSSVGIILPNHWHNGGYHNDGNDEQDCGRDV